MHRIAVTAAAIAAALATGTGAQAQVPTADVHADIDRYLQQRLDAMDVPGAAWAIVSTEGIEHTAAHGEDGHGEPVGESAPFLWGSVAKPVTATAVMTLVEAGSVDLDEPVVTYLPDFALADRAHSDRITVRHLLEQTSGIPEGTGITDRYGDRDDPYSEAIADLADAAPVAEPGAAFEYASANYLVLGGLVEAVTGRPYAEYLRSAVLAPLGMDGAIATAEDAAAVPPGHSYAFGKPVAIDARFDQTGPSYGYLGGTVTDLAAFAAMHLNDGAAGEERILEPESVALTHTGAAEIGDTIDYGLGWRVDQRNADLGTATVWHTGATPGYSAGVILLPELGTAIVMAQNIYGYFQDGPLIGAMLGAARILAGGEAGEPETDPLYATVLAVLVVLVAAALVFTAWTLHGIRKGPKPARRRWLALAGIGGWAAIGLAVACIAGIAAPALAPSRTVFMLIVPDAAWLATALAASALALVAVRTWLGVRRLGGAGETDH